MCATLAFLRISRRLRLADAARKPMFDGDDKTVAQSSTYCEQPRIPTLDKLQLDQMSLSDLRELKSEIEDAIRAIIRSNNAKVANPAATPVAQAAAPPSRVDLERERDAWMAKKMSAGRIG